MPIATIDASVPHQGISSSSHFHTLIREGMSNERVRACLFPVRKGIGQD
jgi:hypothetical protein